MGQRVLTHDPSSFLSCDPMAQQKILDVLYFGQTYLTELETTITGIL
jgi:hypothetical protein